MEISKQAFIQNYMTVFLASYAAANYDMNCLGGKGAEEYNQPIEDAALLAETAWTKLQEIMTA
jgi:hypothetical protein